MVVKAKGRNVTEDELDNYASPRSRPPMPIPVASISSVSCRSTARQEVDRKIVQDIMRGATACSAEERMAVPLSPDTGLAGVP